MDVLIIIGIVSLVLAIICFIGVYFVKELSDNPEKINKILASVGAILFLIGLIITIASGAFSSSSSDEDYGNWSEEASKECFNRSNTYQKCSWSVIEDRCVCKFR